jgi:trans-aconitate 2-methyltransferase
MGDAWDPKQYERFADERSQPFYDLLALVEQAPGMRVVDLGCGTGRLTQVLHRRLGATSTLGVDSAERMLAEAGALAGDGLAFARGEIERFGGGPFDLVFSNAALHWVEDHPALLARLRDLLAPDGQLAVQVPANFDGPAHVVAAEVASEPPFAEALGGYTLRAPVLDPESYARLLHRLGFRRQRVRLEVYAHLLAAPGEVVEWVKGTLLTDYQRRMPATLYPRFVDAYRERLLPRLGEERPFLFPFKRILLWARR